MSSSARITGFERAAGAYEVHAHLQAASAGELAGRLLKLLPGMRRARVLLDLGSGTGLVAQALADQGWPGGVMSLDCSPAMCRMAAARGRQAVVGDALALPFGAQRFAGSASNWAFHWFADPARALAELQRVLELGAPFACTVPSAGSLESWRAALRQAGCTQPISPEFFTMDRWCQLLEDARFETLAATTTPEELVYPSARAFLRHLRGMGALGEPMLAQSSVERGRLLKAVRQVERAGPVRAELLVTTLLARRR